MSAWRWGRKFDSAQKEQAKSIMDVAHSIRTGQQYHTVPVQAAPLITPLAPRASFASDPPSIPVLAGDGSKRGSIYLQLPDNSS